MIVYAETKAGFRDGVLAESLQVAFDTRTKALSFR